MQLIEHITDHQGFAHKIDRSIDDIKCRYLAKEKIYVLSIKKDEREMFSLFLNSRDMNGVYDAIKSTNLNR